MPYKLEQLLKSKGGNARVKSQRIYEEGKVMLIIQTDMTIVSILFDYQGNISKYEPFTLNEEQIQESKDNEFSEVLVNYRGEIFWCFELFEKG